MQNGRYAAKRRLRCLMRIVHRPEGVNVNQASKRVGISLTTYYKWRKRFLSTADALTALMDRRPSGPLHYKSLRPYQEEAILRVILEHPGYGCKKITESLPKGADGKPLVSSGGVQKFLERRRLNLRKYRFKFKLKVIEATLPARRQNHRREERVITMFTA